MAIDSPGSVRLPIDSSNTPLIGLDALRGWAAVAVVVLHASVPYLQPSMPGLDWSVVDRPSGSVTSLFWAIEVVIMPIFLAMAGFLAARSMSRAGANEVMKKRLKSWGKPLLLATVILIPIELYVWLLGWVAEGHITFRKMQSLKLDAEQGSHLWGLSHLWFLQYIMTYVVLLSLGWRFLADQSSSFLSRRVLPATFLAAVVTLVLAPEVVWGFQHAFLPVFSKWLYSGLFFVGGAIWWKCDPDLAVLTRHGDRLLAPSSLFWIASVSFGIWYLSQTAGTLPVRIALAAVTVAAAAGVTFGMMGWCMQHVPRLDRLTQRLSAASLMIYLVHHPIVGLAHISAKYAAADAPTWLKVAAISTLAISMSIGVDYLVGSRQSRVDQAEIPRSTNVLQFKPSQDARQTAAHKARAA